MLSPTSAFLIAVPVLVVALSGCAGSAYVGESYPEVPQAVASTPTSEPQQPADPAGPVSEPEQQSPEAVVPAPASTTAPAPVQQAPAGPSPAEVVATRELRRLLEIEQATLQNRVTYIDRDLPNQQYFLGVANSFGNTNRAGEISQIIASYTSERDTAMARLADIAASLALLPVY